MKLNDFKALTKQIEEAMIYYHAETREEADLQIEKYEAEREKERLAREIKQETYEVMIEESTTDSPPFAKIIEVKQESPADQGGM